jgi:predicted polyphosphate/ATP-dependent NAD kinase
MAKYIVTLTDDEKEGLLSIVGKGSGAAARIRHANILLAVDRGEGGALMMTDEAAAAAYHTTTQTVRNTKRVFVEQGFDAAIGRKQRLTPPKVKIDGETEAMIVALTCSDPPEGYARWSLRLLADKVVELKIMDSVSHVAIGDLLKKTRLSHGYMKSGASPKPLGSS